MSKKSKSTEIAIPEPVQEIEVVPQQKEFAVVIDGITSPSLIFASMEEAQQKVIILSKTRPLDIYEVVEK